MRSRDVVGRTIVAVRQSPPRYNRACGATDCELRSIVLDNGTVIVFSAVETVDCPIVTGKAIKP